MEAFEDILQMTAYFCRRNVKGKDDGMMEGKANMQFWMPSIRSLPAMKA